MKAVGSFWMKSMAGLSAIASSKKKTTVAEHAKDKATRAPKRSANLPNKHKQEIKCFFSQTKTVQVANIC